MAVLLSEGELVSPVLPADPVDVAEVEFAAEDELVAEAILLVPLPVLLALALAMSEETSSEVLKSSRPIGKSVPRIIASVLLQQLVVSFVWRQHQVPVSHCRTFTPPQPEDEAMELHKVGHPSAAPEESVHPA